MPTTIADVVGSYRLEIPSGLTTGIAADGILLSLRHTNANIAIRIKSIDVAFITTTAFTAPQEVGWYAKIARSYSASPTNGTPITVGADGKKRASYPSTTLGGGDVRVASASAITAGTATEDTNPFARRSVWSGAVGAQADWRELPFLLGDPKGIILQQNEGIIIRNLVAMGAGGVGRFVFTIDFDDVILAN